MKSITQILLTLAIASFTLSASMQDVPKSSEDIKLGKTEYSPYLDNRYPDRVYFGDTHVHTSYSTDAGMLGNFLGPDAAFRFARGETVRASGRSAIDLIHFFEKRNS